MSDPYKTSGDLRAEWARQWQVAKGQALQTIAGRRGCTHELRRDPCSDRYLCDPCGLAISGESVHYLASHILHTDG